MFRKADPGTTLELRHQRTSDVVFDICDTDIYEMDLKIQDYVYKMIETLLPKA